MLRKKFRNQESKEIVIDEATDDILQAIADAPEGDVDELVKRAGIDPDRFAAFLKASGREDDPVAKIILDAARRLRNSQGPTYPRP
jgi:hypothetical protein